MNNGIATYVLTWDMDGNLTAELQYQSGKRNGVLLEWYPSGNKRSERVYENDELIDSQNWDENGQIIDTE